MSLDAPLPQDDELWDRIDMGTGPSNGVGNRPDSSNGGHSPRSRYVSIEEKARQETGANVGGDIATIPW